MLLLANLSAKSVYVHRVSSSADSSPLMSTGKNKSKLLVLSLYRRSATSNSIAGASMHPTPLVAALTNRLISQIETQQDRSESKPPLTSSTEIEGRVRPMEDTKLPVSHVEISRMNLK